MSSIDPANPGKYDDECEAVLRKLNANGVMLVVFGGPKGEGFSVSVTDPALLPSIAKILRSVVEQMEKDIVVAVWRK